MKPYLAQILIALAYMGTIHAQGPIIPPPGADPPPAAKSPAVNKDTRPEKPVSLPPALFIGPAGSIESRQKILTEQAGLDEVQQRKLRSILEKHDPAIKKAMTAWRASSSREDRTMASALVQAQNAEITALLTAEQRAKAITARNAPPEWKGTPPSTPSARPSSAATLPGVSRADAPSLPTPAADRPAPAPAR
jgi:hypothetical protein